MDHHAEFEAELNRNLGNRKWLLVPIWLSIKRFSLPIQIRRGAKRLRRSWTRMTTPPRNSRSSKVSSQAVIWDIKGARMRHSCWDSWERRSLTSRSRSRCWQSIIGWRSTRRSFSLSRRLPSSKWCSRCKFSACCPRRTITGDKFTSFALVRADSPSWFWNFSFHSSISEKCDPYKVPVEHVFRSNVLALEDAIRDPEVQIGGLVVLLDMAGLSFAHARYLSPHLAKRTVEVVQEAFPMRFKAFHVLHEPFYMDAILSVLKPFLKDKIRRRIHLHGNDLNSLYKHIPRDCLPAGELFMTFGRTSSE